MKSVGLRYPLALSLSLHLVLFVLVALWARQQLTQPAKKEWMQVDLQPNLKSSQKNKNRIVQTKPTQKADEAPEDAFLGLQNQKVDRQTIAKNKSTQMGSSSRSRSSQSKKSDPQPLRKFGVGLLPPGSRRVQEDPQWATPGARPEDYVPGLSESDHTALNTREFQYYSYYQRIRERLDRAWVPLLRAKLINHYRTGRQLASDIDHTTRVLVVLNDKGEITKVKLVLESGMNDLDEAAIGAFNKAGPFPNPPKGLIDSNHEIQIPWDFILRT